MRSMEIKILPVWLILFIIVVGIGSKGGCGEVSNETWESIRKINKDGKYLGVIVPNSFEMTPLLQSQSFLAHPQPPYLDVLGKRFRLGSISDQMVIVVMTGLGMLNAGITTQLLLSLFRVRGVLHIGISGNANPNLQIADVTIPQYWAHTGLWNWQRNGDGAEDELALESNGDYTRRIGYLSFSKFNNNTDDQNALNNVWFQPEEIFPIFGTPEERQHLFWVAVDEHYFALAKQIEGMELGKCVNATTCLPRKPRVVRVERGVSSSIYVDNGGYANFLNLKFNASAIDMETAAVALLCHQHTVPFIAFRSLSDLAGGNSSVSNEATVFASLAAQNAVDVLIRFISLLPL